MVPRMQSSGTERIPDLIDLILYVTRKQSLIPTGSWLREPQLQHRRPPVFTSVQFDPA